MLLTLVEAYETKHYPIDLPDPVKAIAVMLKGGVMDENDLPLKDDKAICAPTASNAVDFKILLLIIVFTAFVLAFPFAMSLLWFPETMIGVYAGATTVVSGIIILICIFIQSEKSRSKLG